MKAVRSIEGGVAVVELDEPPGTGELLDMRATSICGSDLSYIRFGSRAILGHELAGVREDGTRRGRRGHLRLHGVRAVCAGARTTCARPTASGRSASAPTAGWPSSSVRRRPDWSRCPRASTCATPPSWSRPPSRGTRSGSPGPVRARGSRSSAPVRSGCSPWPAPVGSGRRRSRSRPATLPEGGRRAPGRAGRRRRALRRRGRGGRDRGEPGPCGELVAPGGTIVVLGVHFGPVQLDWMPLFNKEARVIPSLGYCAHDGGREMEDAAAMLADDPDIARTLITHRFPLEEAAEAFRVASDRAGGAVRVVIEPS